MVKMLGGLRVLRGVDAEFLPGLHVIEGANGAGKSTLLSILGGRLSATSGTVTLELDQERLTGRALREEAGWLGHDLGLYPDLTSFENIALHCRLRGVPTEPEWERSSVTMTLDPFRDRRVRDLSRGQRQRVALARALVGAPPVLLLDEPSTGLDANALRKVVDLLGRLALDGVIVLIVTHDEPFRDQLTELAARCWRLAGGRLAEKGD